MATRLQDLAEEEVLDGIREATRSLEQPFCVAGSLGVLPVRMAVRGAGSSEGSAGTSTRGRGRAKASAGGSGGGSGDAARVIELPGSSEDLEALLAECAPAVFGKGKETVRDDSYRSALALPGARLFTQDFEAAHLSGVLAAVGRLLVPAAGPLSARLHALNVYHTGGFFKAHRDTPRGDPGFIGSLVVCLPVGHAGGGLRVEHGGRSVTYDWGAGASAGEVQWAAFYPDCKHEVLEVTQGARVALAYELFARPETASGPPAPLRALPGGARRLLDALRAALDSNSFMVNGGKIGFACKHAYPQSLAVGVDQQAARAMLKGDDAAVLHALTALGVPCEIVHVWEEDPEMEMEVHEFASEEEAERALRALFVSPVGGQAAGKLTMRTGQPRQRRTEGEWEPEFLKQDVGAAFDTSITWLGGRSAFPEWTLGTIGLFYGNEGMYAQECYTCLGIVAAIPAYVDRPTLQPGELAWAGGEPAGAAAGAAASGQGGRKGRGRSK